MKSDVVRIVLIGTGGIGRYHAELWQKMPGAELVGVFDASPKVGAAVAEELGIPRVYATLEEALAEPAADAIDVCTPNRAHTPVVLAALDAQKHCLCEKPLAVTAGEIEEMIAARDRSGKLLMTTQHMRFEQRSVALRKLIEAGELGDVYYGRAWWLRRRRAPTSPGLLRKDQAGHGPALDLGVHMLDLALHFMGFPKPVSVSGVAARRLAQQADVANQWGAYSPEDFEVEDFAAAFVRFEGGAALSLEASWLLNMTEPETRRLWLHGTTGGAEWPEGRLNRVQHGLLLDTQILNDEGEDGHRNALAAFCAAIGANRPSPVPAEQSLMVARILEALYRSAESGREVTL